MLNLFKNKVNLNTEFVATEKAIETVKIETSKNQSTLYSLFEDFKKRGLDLVEDYKNQETAIETHINSLNQKKELLHSESQKVIRFYDKISSFIED